MANSNSFYKKFKRSSNNKIIAGVCGGLAEYFGIDPRLIRLFFVIFILLNAISLFLYVAIWILFPTD